MQARRAVLARRRPVLPPFLPPGLSPLTLTQLRPQLALPPGNTLTTPFTPSAPSFPPSFPPRPSGTHQRRRRAVEQSVGGAHVREAPHARLGHLQQLRRQRRVRGQAGAEGAGVAPVRVVGDAQHLRGGGGRGASRSGGRNGLGLGLRAMWTLTSPACLKASFRTMSPYPVLMLCACAMLSSLLAPPSWALQHRPSCTALPPAVHSPETRLRCAAAPWRWGAARTPAHTHEPGRAPRAR